MKKKKDILAILSTASTIIVLLLAVVLVVGAGITEGWLNLEWFTSNTALLVYAIVGIIAVSLGCYFLYRKHMKGYEK